MRVLLSSYGSRGDVEPMAGPGVESRAPGARVRVVASGLTPAGVRPVAGPAGARCFLACFRRRAVVAGGRAEPGARGGAPQVVVPRIADPPYWAGRVADPGIGTAHDGPVPTAASLSAAPRTTPTRTRAAAVAAEIRTAGAAVATRTIIDSVRREGRS